MPLNRVVIVLTFILSIFVASAGSQSLWEWQHPSPQGNDLFAVDVAGSVTAAVGARGTFMNSTDMGVSWSVVTLAAGQDINLLGVSVVDATTIVTVGKSGKILRTANGGATWTMPSSGTTLDLSDVDFANNLDAIAVGSGGTILRSFDGGGTWTPSASGTAAWLGGVHFVTADVATAVGTNGKVLRTIDGGTTWVAQATPLSTTLNSVHFADINTGIAVGAGPVAIGTTDGGATWASQPMPSFPPHFDVSLQSVFMTGPSDAVAVGPFDPDMSHPQGLMMRTTDGGVSWSWSTEPTHLFGVSMSSTNAGIAVGAAGLIRDVTSGTRWPQIGGGLQFVTARSIDFANPMVGVAITSDNPTLPNQSFTRQFYTDDGGATWQVNDIGGERMLDATFADATTMYAAGRRLGVLDLGAAVWRSTDGGKNWLAIYSTYCAPDGSGCDTFFSEALAVDFAGPGFGVAVGTQGAIVRFENGVGGPAGSPTGVTLRGVSVPSPEAAYAVGDDGTIVKGLISGSFWYEQLSGTSAGLTDVSFSDDMTGTVVGDGGTILRTTDGGTTWLPQISGTTTNLTSVSFIDADNGIVGAGNRILVTVDGGASWVASETTPSMITEAVLLDPVSMVAVGDHENIIARREIPIPVFVQQFQARPTPSSVELVWDVVGDAPVGFKIYRSVDDDVELSLTEGSLEPGRRSFTDRAVRGGGRYTYTLAAIDGDGRETRSQRVDVHLPAGVLSLDQNFPNPFNPVTRIAFNVPTAGAVALAVYDASGRLVRTLISRDMPEGYGDVLWDAKDNRGNLVSSGVYFYRLTAGKQTLTRKAVLLR